jgi:hypothetical protein
VKWVEIVLSYIDTIITYAVARVHGIPMRTTRARHDSGDVYTCVSVCVCVVCSEQPNDEESWLPNSGSSDRQIFPPSAFDRPIMRTRNRAFADANHCERPYDESVA